MAAVGRIARPHGLGGHVIVNPDTDFPEERFQPGSQLFIDRRGRLESMTVTTVWFQQGRPIVGLAGIDSIDGAKALAGIELRVPAERLTPLPAGTFYRHDLVGCQVETAAGALVGVVKEVEGTLVTPRLVVTAGADEILIPLASEICPRIDVGGRKIVINPPDGLLDLNVTKTRKARNESGER